MTHSDRLDHQMRNDLRTRREDAIETYERHGATERAESIREEVRILTPYRAADGSAV